ncbi:MAG: hypothetical protein WCR54_08505, partial [Clostridia bacterium]
MKALALSMSDFTEENLSFDFTNELKELNLSDIKTIKAGIIYALFGSEEPQKGNVEFSFTNNKEIYKIDRNLLDSTISLTKPNNEVVTSKEQITKMLNDIISLGRKQFEELLNCDIEFADFLSNPNTLLDNLQKSTGISNELIQNKILELNATKTSISNRIAYLNEIRNEVPTTEQIEKIELEIEKLRNDLQLNTIELSKTNEGKETLKLLENLKNEYELALDENKKVDFCNEKIINSNKAKEIISFIDVYK